MSSSTKEEEEDFKFGFSLREDGGSLRTSTTPGTASPRLTSPSFGPPSSCGVASMNDPRLRAVLIEGVTHKYLSSVLDRLENRSRGGGRVIHSEKHVRDSEKLIVVFAHSGVAENILRQQKLEILDKTFKISRLPDNYPLPSFISPSPKRSTVSCLENLAEDSVASMVDDSSISAKSVIVKDVPDSHEDCLRYFLENQGQGGGRMLSFKRDTSNSRNMIAVFAQLRVAKQILSLQSVTLVNHTMTFHRVQSEELFQLSQMLDTVKVFNVSEDLSAENLLLYFENVSRANGGPTKNIQLIREKRQAIIQYEESEVAVAVARKGIHNFSGQSMSVVLLEPQLHLSCHAVQVSGIDWCRISKDLLSMYFENNRRSDGGEIMEMITDEEHGQAVITFASGEVAKNVVEKGKVSGHILQKIPLHVGIMKPRSSPLAFQTETEQNRLIVKGLTFRITLSKLSEYMERVCKCKILGWVLSSKPNTAMLEFDGEPDYRALRRQVDCIPLCGHMIGIQKMPLSTFVQVSGFSGAESIDDLLDYFKGQIGAGLAICYEQKTETSVVLQFHSHSVAEVIQSKTHIINGRTLSVHLWSKELGRTLPVKASTEPTDNCPRMLNVVCTQLQLFCIKKSSFVRRDIEKKFEGTNCIVKWPLAVGDLGVQLELVEESMIESQLWPDKCLDLFQSCLEDLFCQNFVTTPELWIKLKEKIKQDVSELICEFDEEKCKISVYGFSHNVKEYVQRIKEMEEEIKKRLETLDKLKPHQIQYIKIAGIVDEMKSRLPRLTVQADDEAVSLFGKEEDLTEAKLHIYASLNNVDSRFVDLTESLSELIAAEPTLDFVKDYFGKNQVRVIIQRSQEKPGCTIYGTEDDSRMAEEFLRLHFVESRIEMSNAAKQAAQSSEWPQFVNDLKENYRFVIIKPKTDVCIIACRKDLLDAVKSRLSEMFDRYALVEVFLSMKLSHTELFSQHMELQKLDKKLRESAVGGELKQIVKTSGTSGFAVKGQHEAVETVRMQLETFAKNVIEKQHEINQPGIITLMQSVEGQERVRVLQDEYSTILKMVVGEATYLSASSNQRPRVQCCSEIEKDHEIILELGDIMDIATDAVINPCNPRIELSRGLGLEIVRMGGKEIERACNDHIKTHGVLLPGKVFVSETKKLLCEAIIHVVEPTAFDSSAVNVFKLAVESVLEEAIKRNFATVVFPLHFGVAFKRQLLFSTMKDFFKKNSTTALKKILFCDNDAALLAEFEKQLKVYESSAPVPSVTTTPGASSPVQPPSSLVTPEGIVVKFFKGSICVLEVDAIVNSTARNLTLGSGGISKAILSAAGSEIERECRAKAPNGLGQFGDVVRSNPYKLSNCKAVYHGAAIQWDKSAPGQCIKVLRTFISQALTQAHRDGMTSIALPAIGSGTLKVPHDTVTDVLFDEIFKFSKSYPNTCLKTIYTVAFDKNQPSVTAFEKKYLELEPQYRPRLSNDDSQAVTSNKILRTYDETVNFTITSLSQNVIQTIQNELKKFVDDASEKKTFEIQNAVTEEQLERIDFLQTIHCVRIVQSNNLITFEGLKNDVISAAEKFKYIIKNS